MKKINVGLIGFGTIGSGVAETLLKKQKFIKDHSGLDIRIKRVCDKSPSAARKAKKTGAILTKRADDIIKDKEIDIVVELIGGIKEAGEIITKAIKAGKHVVTANKALLAMRGRDIFELAEKKRVLVRFDASVGGGIPIIKALREDYISNRIDTIYGIINGTSNFILTGMAKEKYDFRKALFLAQKKGFAERNPELDINGIDSAHKLAILVLVGFKFPIKFSDIYVEGIKSIEQSDIEYAGEAGYTIKLLGIAKRVGERLEARVHPTLLPKAHVLSSVDGTYNAIHVKGDLIGESLFYGEGAGKLPTASTVISDIVGIGMVSDAGSVDRLLVPDYENSISGMEEFGGIKIRHYIRFSAVDKPGVLASISGILARRNISIASVTQKERKQAHAVPIVMMTHEAVEADMQKAMKEISGLNIIKGKPVRIRMEN